MDSSETTGKETFVNLEVPSISRVIGENRQEAVISSQHTPSPPESTSGHRSRQSTSKSSEVKPIILTIIEKVNLQSGSPRRNTRRIFVAKIPSHVTEQEMKKYFERFGKVEDAYRPKDFAKNTFRGIGFITFVHASSTEKVIDQVHELGGSEVVVDRATPKASKTSSQEDLIPANSLGQLQSTLDWLKGSEDYVQNEEVGQDLAALQKGKSPIGSVATSRATNRAPSSTFSDDLCDFNAGIDTITSGTSLQVKSGKSGKNLKNSTNNNLSHVRRLRGGPRIFVGKLAKDTVEQDLADYFSKFGFVMDVYIPRAKENKKEHRGFGFVTFETEASIKRTVAQGTHTLKGSVLAIDVAVPENNKT